MNLKEANEEFGEKIIYGHLASCGIDNLLKKVKENELEYGNRNYSELAKYLMSFPL